MMKIWATGLETVFSNGKYAWLALALFFVFLALYAVLNDVVVFNPFYAGLPAPDGHALPPVSFNSSLSWWDAVPTVLLAGLAALGFSIAAFQMAELSRIAPASKLGAAGGFMGAFASACPICQPVWLLWLGFGSVSAFLADWSIYIFAASLLLLAFSIHASLQAVVSGCPMRKM